ncbi:MAG: hypothetical protein ACKN9T_10465 [Candidatus Methylumidiphilus sp.]
MIENIKSEDISAYSALVTAVIALVALIIAVVQVVVSKHEARLGIAKSIYKDYLALAFANPQLSSPSYPKNSPRFKTFSKSTDDYERYEYFVSYLLFAAEEILDLTKNSTAWRNTLRDQIRWHALYLESVDFIEQHYSFDLLALVEEAISEYNNEDTHDGDV